MENGVHDVHVYRWAGFGTKGGGDSGISQSSL